MNPTEIHPPFVLNLGYDLNEMNDSEKVTLVRRRVVYEELVMSVDKFEKMNEKIKNNIESDDEFYLDDLEMEHIGFTDIEETHYTAFPGDVTSFTDDAISFWYENKTWTDPYEPVEISS